MHRSNRVRLRDVGQLMELMGELSAFQPVSQPWKQHLLDRVLKLIPAKVAFLPELENFSPGGKVSPRSTIAAGWMSEAGARDFGQWAQDGEYERDHPGMAVMMATTTPLFTQRRVEQVSDDQWYRSPVVNEHLCVSEIDDNLNSIIRLDNDGWIIGLAMFRDQQDRTPFSRRERLLLHLLHRGLYPIYRRYANFTRQTSDGLTPRMQETLEHLLAGDSEKQIARKMHLSRHTVHDYVKKLHRHFDVSSRAELLSVCLQQHGVSSMPDNHEAGNVPNRARYLVIDPQTNGDHRNGNMT